MKFKAFHGENEHDVEVKEVEGGYRLNLNEEVLNVDTVRLEQGFYSLLINGQSFEVSVKDIGKNNFTVRHGSYARTIKVIDPLAAVAGAGLHQSGRAEITAVMPGRVLRVLVESGQAVAEGQGLIVLEAMKMENEVEAPRAGKVSELSVKEGDTLETGAKILIIE